MANWVRGRAKGFRLGTAVAATALAVSLAACGSSSDGSGASGASAPAATGGATGTSFPMTVTSYDDTTPLGTATIPRKPQRVVVIDATQLVDSALALHVPLVGVTSDAKKTGYGSLYADQLKSVPGIGSRPNFDFEKIAALHPDLILGLSAEFDTNFAKFNAIAPTVAVPYVTTQRDWEFFPEQVGSLTGNAPAASAIVARERAAAVPLQARFRKGYQVAVLQPFASAKKITLCYFTPGRLFSYLGATVNQAAKKTDCNPIPPENLNSVTDPNIFVVNVNGGDSGLKFLQSQALWTTLPAVKAGHAFYVPSNWAYAGGPIAYFRTLSEIPSMLPNLPK